MSMSNPSKAWLDRQKHRDKQGKYASYMSSPSAADQLSGGGRMRELDGRYVDYANTADELSGIGEEVVFEAPADTSLGPDLRGKLGNKPLMGSRPIGERQETKVCDLEYNSPEYLAAAASLADRETSARLSLIDQKKAWGPWNPDNLPDDYAATTRSMPLGKDLEHSTPSGTDIAAMEQYVAAQTEALLRAHHGADADQVDSYLGSATHYRTIEEVHNPDTGQWTERTTDVGVGTVDEAWSDFGPRRADLDAKGRAVSADYMAGPGRRTYTDDDASVPGGRFGEPGEVTFNPDGSVREMLFYNDQGQVETVTRNGRRVSLDAEATMSIRSYLNHNPSWSARTAETVDDYVIRAGSRYSAAFSDDPETRKTWRPDPDGDEPLNSYCQWVAHEGGYGASAADKCEAISQAIGLHHNA